MKLTVNSLHLSLTESIKLFDQKMKDMEQEAHVIMIQVIYIPGQATLQASAAM
jgi:hypothetical protein